MFLPVLNKIIVSENTVKEIFRTNMGLEKPLLITYLNQHAFNNYCRSDEYRQAIDNFLVYPEGTGIYYALKFLAFKNIERINATELNYQLLDFCIKKNIGIYIIGGNFDRTKILSKSAETGINLLGYDNGFFDEDNFSNITLEIKKANPKIIFIGMGIPKQEIFALNLNKNFPLITLVCVGNFFEFYFGTVKRAPKFLRNSGFEWLFRLFTEPRRLFKRYIFGIPLFIFTILKLKLKRDL
jgi:exopolysaccharide biosynthesis WecB/TagA/CpsF family protein